MFAEGSLRTHKDKLVGIRASFEKYRCVPKIASPEARTNCMYYGPTGPRYQESGLCSLVRGECTTAVLAGGGAGGRDEEKEKENEEKEQVKY